MQSLPNPSQLQWSPSKSASLPLYLIHDGAGTIFQYSLLPSLSRDVYGIYNLLFDDGGRWDGGISEMAHEYARLIIASQRRRGGPIIVGGWSLGGILALEVAHILHHSPPASIAGTPEITIAGLVMIDSLCPNNRSLTSSVPQLQFHSRTNARMRLLSQQNMDSAVEMLREYTSPLTSSAWSRRGNDTTDGDANGNADSNLNDAKPPHAILLRATNNVPVAVHPISSEGIDSTRTKRALGWEDGEIKVIQTILDVPGHHFDMFDDEHIEALSNQLKLACSMIEHSLDE